MRKSIALVAALLSCTRRPKLPPDVEPNNDVATFEQWVKLPLRPDRVWWRGSGRASGGRIGILHYEVHGVIRFDGARWQEALRFVRSLPEYKEGSGSQFWSQWVIPEVLPLLEGPDNRLTTYRDATSVFAGHPSWRPSRFCWINALGDGPWMALSCSTESRHF